MCRVGVNRLVCFFVVCMGSKTTRVRESKNRERIWGIRVGEREIGRSGREEVEVRVLSVRLEFCFF